MSDETSKASSFRFLFSSESPSRTVLEFDTDSHLARVLLSQGQLDPFVDRSEDPSVKPSWRSQDSEST
jgi:hypothetical protein